MSFSLQGKGGREVTGEWLGLIVESGGQVVDIRTEGRNATPAQLDKIGLRFTLDHFGNYFWRWLEV